MYTFNWRDDKNVSTLTPYASHAYKNICANLRGETVILVEIGMSVYRNADGTYYGYVNFFYKDDFKNFCSKQLESLEKVKKWCEYTASEFLDSMKADLAEA